MGMKAKHEQQFVFIHGQSITKGDPRRLRRLARNRLRTVIDSSDVSGVILAAMYKDAARNCDKIRYVLRRRENYQTGAYSIKVIRKPKKDYLITWGF